MSPEQSHSGSERAKVPVLSLTPLYCIVTDADEIPLTDESKIVRYSQDRLKFLGENDQFLRHLDLYPPQCLLSNEDVVPLETLTSFGMELSKLTEEYKRVQDADILRGRIESTPSLIPYFSGRAHEVQALQLFRRGRLVVGDSLIMFAPPLNIRMMARLTDMTVDYQDLNQYAPHYEFNSADVRDFLIFRIRFMELSIATTKLRRA